MATPRSKRKNKRSQGPVASRKRKTKTATETIRAIPDHLRQLGGQDLEGYTLTMISPGLPKLLGAGDWGYVLEAVDSLGEKKAVKILSAERASTAAAVEHFSEEIFKLRRAKHPNIVRVEHAGRIPGELLGDLNQALPYFVMEYVDGGVITDWIRDQDSVAMTSDFACDVIRQLLAAIEHIHEKQIFHLDLKPRNILMTTDGIPKVADFGLAQLVGSRDTLSARSSLAGRDINAMHPDFRDLLGSSFSLAKLRPEFDLFGLGYTLEKIRERLQTQMSAPQRYFYNAIVFRLTRSEPRKEVFPSREMFGTAELTVPEEYSTVSEVKESLRD